MRDERSQPPHVEPADFVLDWGDPRTWRLAVDRAVAFGADALVLPWLHPVMAPPYAWLLRASRGRFRRIVICHNVLPHERVPFAAPLTRGVLRGADTIVTHAPAQRGELEGLGLKASIVEAFHPLFVPGELASAPTPEAIAAERARSGNPELLLLLYGAVRPYKGVDLALEALARVDPRIDVRLVVAGRFWTPREELERHRAATRRRRDGSSSATAMSRTRRPPSCSAPATRPSCRTAARPNREWLRSRWGTAGRCSQQRSAVSRLPSSMAPTACSRLPTTRQPSRGRSRRSHATGRS